MRIAAHPILLLIAIGLTLPAVESPVSAMSRSATAPAIRSLSPVDSTERARKGVEAAQSDRPDQAIRLLEPLVEARPDLLVPGSGLAAYWLGRAYRARDQVDHALATWQQCLRRLNIQGRFDLRIGDALVRTAFRPNTGRSRTSKGYTATAVRAYLKIVEHAGSNLSSASAVIVNRHLRQLSVVLPESVQKTSGIEFDAFEMKVTVEPVPDSGRQLLAWWRSQDPLAATPLNERLIEHLRRVSVAQTKYASGGQLDDRGLTYIRFGDPSRNVELTLDNAFNVDPQRVQIRANELWTYEDVHRQAYFIFVEKDPGSYELGRVDDLIPARSRPMIGNAERSRKYLFALEKVLRQLAVHSEDYAMRYVRVADFAAWERERNGGVSIGNNRVDGPPGSFASSVEARIQNLDRRFAAQRAERVPKSSSDVLDGTVDLPVYYRVSRFLTPSDSTELQITWSVRSRDLLPDDELQERFQTGNPALLSPPYVLRSVAAQKNPDYVDRTIHFRQHLVDPGSSEEAIVSPRTISATVGDSLSHLSLQWDQFQATRQSDGGATQVRQRLRRHVRRIDSIRALDGRDSLLEMSDLVVRTQRDGSGEDLVSPSETVPYPFTRVRPSTSLALFFEVYHLTMGNDGQTEYTVAYEIRRATERGGVAGLFGGKKTDETITETTYRGRKRRTEEYVIVDLAELDPSKQTDVEIRVRVTDEHSGQAVSRLIELTVVPQSS